MSFYGLVDMRPILNLGGARARVEGDRLEIIGGVMGEYQIMKGGDM